MVSLKEVCIIVYLCTCIPILPQFVSFLCCMFLQNSAAHRCSLPVLLPSHCHLCPEPFLSREKTKGKKERTRKCWHNPFFEFGFLYLYFIFGFFFVKFQPCHSFFFLKCSFQTVKRLCGCEHEGGQ